MATSLLFGGFTTAVAGDLPSFADEGALAACDAETAERILFIERRLENAQPYARRWWIFWTVFYGTGVIYSFVQGAMKDENGNRANSFVSGSKAIFGTARLMLSRHTAKQGADPMQELQVDSAAGCEEVLSVGEDLLRRNAQESRSRYSWKRHLANVGINVVGALIVAEGYGRRKKGWTSAAVGIAVGEVFTWTKPWNGSSDLEDYERKFNGGRAPVAWNIVPTVGGLQVQARY
jgi:hypothetical protein